MIIMAKNMETGVELIDEQHRELIGRINNVTKMGTKSASEEETERTIDLLGEYIIKHFTDEETLQQLCHYPKYKWHKGLHHYYIKEFQKLKNEFDANGPSVRFTLDLHNSIINWIVRHIKSVDAEFGEYYRKQIAESSKQVSRHQALNEERKVALTAVT